MAIYMWKEWSFKPGANTLVWLPIDGADDGSNVYDHSGNNNYFVWGATPQYDTLSTGKRVLTLNSSYIQRGAAYLSGKKTFTLSIWFNVINISTNYMLFEGNFRYQSNKTYGFNLYTGASTTATFGLGTNNEGASGYVNVTANTWTNIILSIAAQGNGTSIAKITANGSSATPVTISGEVVNNGGTTRIGANRGGNQLFPGKIGEVIIEDKEWSDLEKSEYFNMSKLQYGLS